MWARKRLVEILSLPAGQGRQFIVHLHSLLHAYAHTTIHNNEILEEFYEKASTVVARQGVLW